MELKFSAISANIKSHSLLIVLNGIEIKESNMEKQVIYLLIVLNGIEIRKEENCT